jgi:hypothetical protein
MNTAITSHHHVETRGHTPGWIATLWSGVRWGIEMRRRYDSEVAAGRRPDAEAIRRMGGEVDAWLGRPA